MLHLDVVLGPRQPDPSRPGCGWRVANAASVCTGAPSTVLEGHERCEQEEQGRIPVGVVARGQRQDPGTKRDTTCAPGPTHGRSTSRWSVSVSHVPEGNPGGQGSLAHREWPPCAHPA